MTTIIMVTIGVLLAAVSMIFMYFYGGSAYGGSAAKEEAARLVGEGVQIQAAYQTFKAQEDRTPGNGTGVDAMALKDMVCHKYLTQIPRGSTADAPPTFDCTSSAPPPSTASSWKLDYNYGIARAVVGPATTASGGESSATAVCRAARKQVGLAGDPVRCDASDISYKEPCCIMSAADAAA